MTAEAQPDPQHDDVFLDIPWLVVGRLTPTEEAAAHRHIEGCPRCQTELREQTQIRELVAAPEKLEFTPGASLIKLKARINELERGVPELAARRSAQTLPDGAPPRWLRPLLLAQVAAVVLVTGLLIWSATERWATPRYQTATNTELLAAKGRQVRLVVAPSTPVAELAALLRAVNGVIIGGPNAEGAWTVQLAASMAPADEAALLAHMHEDRRVLLIEPVFGGVQR